MENEHLARLKAMADAAGYLSDPDQAAIRWALNKINMLLVRTRPPSCLPTLKPCPHCSAAPIITRALTNHCFVECPACGARGSDRWSLEHMAV